MTVADPYEFLDRIKATNLPKYLRPHTCNPVLRMQASEGGSSDDGHPSSSSTSAEARMPAPSVEVSRGQAAAAAAAALTSVGTGEQPSSPQLSPSSTIRENRRRRTCWPLLCVPRASQRDSVDDETDYALFVPVVQPPAILQVATSSTSSTHESDVGSSSCAALIMTRSPSSETAPSLPSPDPSQPQLPQSVVQAEAEVRPAGQMPPGVVIAASPSSEAPPPSPQPDSQSPPCDVAAVR